MDFLRNVYDYFRRNNMERNENENKFVPNADNYSQNIIEEIPRVEMDIELPQDFIINNFGGNKPYDDDNSSFHIRENVPFFGEFSNLFQMISQFGEVMREIDRQFSGPMEFHNFPQAIYGDMTDGVFREPEKTLTGENLRNYYLNGNNIDGNQIVALNDKESDDHQSDLIINNNNNGSDITSMPYFKSQSRFFTTKIGSDGVAEITTILRDESGNEEKTVRKVKLF